MTIDETSANSEDQEDTPLIIHPSLAELQRGVCTQPRRVDSDHRFATRGKSLIARVWERVQAGQDHECWPWVGGRSRGGKPNGRQRSTPYGIVNEGSLHGGNTKRVWRPHIVVLLSKEITLVDVPMDLNEDYIVWLHRARRYYTQHLGLQAAHGCDNSLCCNPRHLEWESQEQNLADQRWRAEQRRKDPNWVPPCCEIRKGANG